MSQSMQNLKLLFFPCVVVVLTGCQHPLATGPSEPHSALVNHDWLAAQTTVPAKYELPAPAPAATSANCVVKAVTTEGPKPVAAPTSGTKKAPDSLTLQLGDCLVSALKIATGH
jgi:hypothetical protein